MCECLYIFFDGRSGAVIDVVCSITMFLPGKVLPLLSVVKRLFRHVFDVLSNVPSFQSEYGIILRDLLAVRGYCFHMGKCIYRSEFSYENHIIPAC